MSGITEWPTRATYALTCQKCAARWESPETDAMGWKYEGACDAAFDLGWRVYVGQRTQHTYCPEHGPSTSMRLLHGEDR